MFLCIKVILLLCISQVLTEANDYTRKHGQVPEYLPKQNPKEVTIPLAEDHDPEPEPYKVTHHSKYPPNKPYQYKQPKPYCNPKEVPKCAMNSTLHFCLEDLEYPHEDVQAALAEDIMLARQYADVKDQSADDLVDGVSALQEKAFDYSLYNGKQFDKGNWVGGEGYICPSHVEYARPLRAKNIEGEWRVIVNDPSHCTQTERIEVCLFPNAPCRTLAPCYKSQCIQKYVYHRILSFDPCDPYKGIFFDMYKLPSACSCHIPKAHL